MTRFLFPLAPLAMTAGASASFTFYGGHTGWLAAVGGPTVARHSYDYFPPQFGQPVSSELWSDVGVHFVSSQPLHTGVVQTWGATVECLSNSSFQVRFDQPITALWYIAYTPGASIAFFSGNTFLGAIGDGILGVTSTIAFDRISLNPGGGIAGIIELEWNTVPAPGGLALLALALGGAPATRRSRASTSSPPDPHPRPRARRA